MNLGDYFIDGDDSNNFKETITIFCNKYFINLKSFKLDKFYEDTNKLTIGNLEYDNNFVYKIKIKNIKIYVNYFIFF
jgi:hypothetical protein